MKYQVWYILGQFFAFFETISFDFALLIILTKKNSVIAAVNLKY